MILSIFSGQNTEHIIELFLWMLGSFLIGWLFGRKLIHKKEIVKPEIDDNFIDLTVVEDSLEPENVIRATKTFDRGVAVMKPEVSKPVKVAPKHLDLSRLGEGSPKNSDDLKKIRGIGPAIEEKLQNIGIFNYSQISKFTPDDIEIASLLMDIFPKKIERDHWLEQANELQNASDKSDKK